jgi:hypothetical protein
MVADVVAHELKHASDDRAGLFQSLEFSDCITREQRAYGVEQRFLRWMWAGQLFPTEYEIAGTLSFQDFELYENLLNMITSPDVNRDALIDYLGHC